jgi:hypothetical protein
MEGKENQSENLKIRKNSNLIYIVGKSPQGIKMIWVDWQ